MYKQLPLWQDEYEDERQSVARRLFLGGAIFDDDYYSIYRWAEDEEGYLPSAEDPMPKLPS